jgi:hypothetical protein
MARLVNLYRSTIRSTLRNYTNNNVSRHSARSSRYQRAARELRDEQLPCAICHHPIDYDLQHPHPYSFSVDHAIPRARAPHLDETIGLRPAHLLCNQKKSDTMTTPAPQRDW